MEGGRRRWLTVALCLCELSVEVGRANEHSTTSTLAQSGCGVGLDFFLVRPSKQGSYTPRRSGPPIGRSMRHIERILWCKKIDLKTLTERDKLFLIISL